MTAAAARHPVGSTTIFMRVAKKRICSRNCASLTVTMSLTSRCMIGNVSLPTAVVCAPSAIVRGTRMRTMRPLRSDCCASLPASGSTPMTLHAGDELRRRQRATADQAAAADADEQVVERADLVEQLPGDRALSRDDVGVVEGWDQRAAALGGKLAGDRLAIARWRDRRE